MNLRRTPKDKPTPPIVKGARILAACSVIWSGYAISDLMHSGPWGITVAIAGDIGWITVLWAEANRVRIAGRTWPAIAAGWLIAVGVGVLLAVHGTQGPDGSWAKAMAGVLVIAVSKIVSMFALAATIDRTALSPEQEAEIDAVIRDSSYTAQLHEARADAEIARIRAEARTTLARDEADFEVSLERVRKRAELQRRTPLALPPGGRSDGFEAAVEVPVRPLSAPSDNGPDSQPDTSGQDGEPSGHNAATSTDTRPDSPDVLSVIAQKASGPSDLVRSLAAHGVPKNALVSEAVRLRPDIKADSIRRTAKRLGEGPYL